VNYLGRGQLFLLGKLCSRNLCPYNQRKVSLLVGFMLVITKKAFFARISLAYFVLIKSSEDSLLGSWFASRMKWPLKWQALRFALPRVRPMLRCNNGYESRHYDLVSRGVVVSVGSNTPFEFLEDVIRSVGFTLILSVGLIQRFWWRDAFVCRL
jgi:hypothetical protein